MESLECSSEADDKIISSGADLLPVQKICHENHKQNFLGIRISYDFETAAPESVTLSFTCIAGVGQITV